MINASISNSATYANDQLSDDLYVDLLVVGGGIVGSGVARDAAMRGLSTLLVEQRDFASGTSSRSSRLLHGGLRYLAQCDIALVREASVEKLVVQKIAPHLAEPLPFIFPTRRATPWPRWKLGIGVKLYDLLCSRRNFGRSATLSTARTLDLLPWLNTTNLTGAVRYYDGLTNDARLVLDTLRSAAANGANVCNYTRFISAKSQGDKWVCVLDDQRGGRQVAVHARCIVNAAGAWASAFEASKLSLRLTKGVHLVIDRARLRVPEAVVMTEGKRILFAIPWGERLILGTTDTDYDGDLAEPSCDASDVQYILDVTNRTFGSPALTREHVISAWSGLRPLIARGDDRGTPSDISRGHSIHMTEPGWIDVAGGKLTTYRRMAQQTVDEVVRYTRCRAEPCRTADIELLDDPSEFSGILPPAVSSEAVKHYCINEWAMHLDDVMIRRTSWRYYHADHVMIAQRVAQWMAQLLNWDDQVLHEQVERYRRVTAVQPFTDNAGQAQTLASHCDVAKMPDLHPMHQPRKGAE